MPALVTIFIELLSLFWAYFIRILFIEKILRLFGLDPHKPGIKHRVLMHIIQFALVLIIIFVTIIIYLSFIRYGLYI